MRKTFKNFTTKILLALLSVFTILTMFSPMSVYAKQVEYTNTGTGNSSGGTSETYDGDKASEKKEEDYTAALKSQCENYSPDELLNHGGSVEACVAQLKGEVSTVSDFEPTHDRIVIAPLLDENTNSVSIEVVDETDESTSRVAGKDNFGYYFYSWAGSGKTTITKEISDENQFYLSFPGNSYDYEQGVSSKDEALATNVSSILQNSFDEFYAYLKQHVKDANKDKLTITKLATDFWNGTTEDAEGRINGSFKSCGMVISVSSLDYSQNAGLDEAKDIKKYEINEGVGKGTSAKNYSVIKVSSGGKSGVADKYLVMQVSVPKGYSSGQYADGDFNSSDTKTANHAYISMRGIACIAYNMSTKGYVVGETGYKKIYGTDDNIITTMFKTLFNSILKTLYAAIGVDDVTDLVFNRGGRSVSYYYGITPTKYMNVAQIFYWLAMIVAGFVLFYSIILTAAKRTAADISPSIRVDVKNTILNILKAFLGLIFFPTIFSIMCKANLLIVDMFGGMISDTASLFDIGVSTIGYIMVSFITFGITVALNVKYIIRSIIVTLCYCIAPIAISSTVIDDRKAIFSVWLKELIANIFMQGFNAMVLAFLFMTTTSSRGIVRLIIIYSLIPLNKWFMEDLCGVTNMASKVADATTRTLNERAQGAASSMLEVKSGADKRIEAANRLNKLTGGTRAAIEGGSGGASGGPSTPSGANSLKNKIAYGGKLALGMGIAGATEMGGLRTNRWLDQGLGRWAAGDYANNLENSYLLGNKGYSSSSSATALFDSKGNIVGHALSNDKDSVAKLRERQKTLDGSHLAEGSFLGLNPEAVTKEEANAMSMLSLDKKYKGNHLIKDSFGNTTGTFVESGYDAFDAIDAKRDAYRDYQEGVKNGYAGWTRRSLGFQRLDEDGNVIKPTSLILPSGARVSTMSEEDANMIRNFDLDEYASKNGFTDEDKSDFGKKKVIGNLTYADVDTLKSVMDNPDNATGYNAGIPTSSLQPVNITSMANMPSENLEALDEALDKHNRHPGANLGQDIYGNNYMVTNDGVQKPNAIRLSGNELAEPTSIKKMEEEVRIFDNNIKDINGQISSLKEQLDATAKDSAERDSIQTQIDEAKGNLADWQRRKTMALEDLTKEQKERGLWNEHKPFDESDIPW